MKSKGSRKRSSVEPSRTELSDEDLNEVAGGVFGLERLFGSHSVDATTPEPVVKSGSTAARMQVERDVFDNKPTTNLPKTAIDRSLKGLSDGLVRLAPPPEAFATPQLADAHLAKLASFRKLIERNEVGVLTNQNLTENERQDRLNALEQLHIQRSKFEQTTRMQRDDLVVKPMLDAHAAIAESGLTQDVLTQIADAIAATRGIAMHTLSDAHRESLAKKRDEMATTLKRLGTKAKSDEALALAGRLEQMIVPLGAGPRIRFEHARYDNSTTPVLISKGLEANLAEQTEARATVDARRIRGRYPNVSSITEAKDQSPNFGRVAMLESMGIKPGQETLFLNKKLPRVIAHLESLAGKQGAYYFHIKGHAMAIFTDPATNTYRFFDPNYGLYRFYSPKEFAEKVIRFVNDNYSNAKKRYPFTIDYNLETRVNQGVGDGNKDLGNGVCAAMSAHVGRWFLEHPNYKGVVTAQMLGLGEFDPQSAQRAKPARTPAASSGQILDELFALEKKGKFDDIFKMIAEKRKTDPDNVFLKKLESQYAALAKSNSAAFEKAIGEGDVLFQQGKFALAFEKYWEQAVNLKNADKQTALAHDKAKLAFSRAPFARVNMEQRRLKEAMIKGDRAMKAKDYESARYYYHFQVAKKLALEPEKKTLVADLAKLRRSKQWDTILTKIATLRKGNEGDMFLLALEKSYQAEKALAAVAQKRGRFRSNDFFMGFIPIALR
jgi:cell pole-organizing protein PopZ